MIGERSRRNERNEDIARILKEKPYTSKRPSDIKPWQAALCTAIAAIAMLALTLAAVQAWDEETRPRVPVMRVEP